MFVYSFFCETLCSLDPSKIFNFSTIWKRSKNSKHILNLSHLWQTLPPNTLEMIWPDIRKHARCLEMLETDFEVISEWGYDRVSETFNRLRLPKKSKCESIQEMNIPEPDKPAVVWWKYPRRKVSLSGSKLRVNASEDVAQKTYISPSSWL